MTISNYDEISPVYAQMLMVTWELLVELAWNDLLVCFAVCIVGIKFLVDIGLCSYLLCM